MKFLPCPPKPYSTELLDEVADALANSTVTEAEGVVLNAALQSIKDCWHDKRTPEYICTVSDACTRVQNDPAISVPARLYWWRMLVNERIQVTYTQIPEFSKYVQDYQDLVRQTREHYGKNF